MPTTYQYNVRLLSNFLRKQKIVTPIGNAQAAIPNLFEAIMQEKGDFTSKGAETFPFADKTIDTALWYQKATSPATLPDIPIFSFDNLMSTLVMLSSAIPEVGMFANIATSAGQQVLGNITQRLRAQVQLSEVSNPQPDPFQQIADKVIGKAETDQVIQDINTLFSQIHEVQQVLNEHLLNPSELLNNPKPGLIKALKTRPGLTREYVLEALGQVFTLEQSDTWRKLSGANNEYTTTTIMHGLLQDPTYAQATLTAFLHAALTVVTAMLAYGFLYPLPPKAFEPDWDGKNLDGTPYDPIFAIHATKDVPHEPLPKNAWDALNTVFDLVNPSGQLSVMPRLKEIDEIWNIIYARLSSVVLQTGLPANRNGYWYLEEDRTGDNSPTHLVTASYMVESETRWDVITNDACSDNQVAFVDWSLPQEPFLAPYTNFHTHLTQNWKMAVIDLNESVLSNVLNVVTVGGAPLAGLGGYALWLNENFQKFQYPLVKEGNAPTVLYEVFWTPASANDNSLNDASLPGFLSTQQGADVCAWLGFLLATYCDAYGFKIDLTNDTNTLDLAYYVGEVFYNIYLAIGQFLGVSVCSPPVITETPKISVTFSNTSGRTVSVSSLNFDATETLQSRIGPDNPDIDLEQVPGYVFIIRDATSHEVLLTYTIPDQNPPTVEVPTYLKPPSNMRSVDHGVQIKLTFSNVSGQTVLILWVDYEGREWQKAALVNGNTYAQLTSLGNIWKVRYPNSGELLLTYTVRDVMGDRNVEVKPA